MIKRSALYYNTAVAIQDGRVPIAETLLPVANILLSTAPSLFKSTLLVFYSKAPCNKGGFVGREIYNLLCTLST